MASGRRLADPGRTLRPAVFLDRDGTILVERNYLSDPAGVELLEGAAEALRRFQHADYLLVVVTNQSGIARGLYDEAAYAAVTRRMEELLSREGVRLDLIVHCPHHPDFTGPCDCRKPGLGLFRQAAETLGIDTRRSVFIGDRPGDVEPAVAMGGKAILVLTGYGREHTASLPDSVSVAADLRAAADRVLGSAEDSC